MKPFLLLVCFLLFGVGIVSAAIVAEHQNGAAASTMTIQSGQCTLNGAATAVCTFTVAYTNATSYVCTTSTQTNTNTHSVARTSATVVTITSAVTLDVGVINLICVGT